MAETQETKKKTIHFIREYHVLPSHTQNDKRKRREIARRKISRTGIALPGLPHGPRPLKPRGSLRKSSFGHVTSTTKPPPVPEDAALDLVEVEEALLQGLPADGGE